MRKNRFTFPVPARIVSYSMCSPEASHTLSLAAAPESCDEAVTSDPQISVASSTPDRNLRTVPVNQTDVLHSGRVNNSHSSELTRKRRRLFKVLTMSPESPLEKAKWARGCAPCITALTNCCSHLS